MQNYNNLTKTEKRKKLTILQVKSDGKEIVHEELPRSGEKFSTKKRSRYRNWSKYFKNIF
jgi:hypothetical protein